MIRIVMILCLVAVAIPDSQQVYSRLVASNNEIENNSAEDARGESCISTCIADEEDPDECREQCIQTVGKLQLLRIACR